MFKIGTFSKNIVFYVRKLNHCFWHCFPGAWTLICVAFCSFGGFCIKVVELPTGNEHLKKVMELRCLFAQLVGGAIETLGALTLNRD